MTRKSSSEENLSRSQRKKNIERGDEKIAEENNRQNEFKTPAPERQKVPNIAFTTPQQYRQAIDQINGNIKSATDANKSIVYTRGIVATEGVMKNRRKKTEEDLYQMSDGTKIMIEPEKNYRTKPYHHPVIVQSEDGFSFTKSLRKSSHDELFQVAENKKGTFEEYDKELNLRDEEGDITFQEAFYLARVKNKELHTFNTGHVGAIFNKIDTDGIDGSVTAGYFKESKEESKKDRKKKSNETGEDEKKGWDAEKNEIIKKVVDEDKFKQEEEKKKSPIIATAELLKLAVEKVVRYEDNTEENREKFQYAEPKKGKEIDKKVLPYTTDGLNLADDIEREFALKTSQAARDKWKMAVLALEDKFNFIDSASEAENYTYKDKKSIIKRKVERITIKEAIHGGEDRNFSPIRSGTPYSDFNFDLVFEQLEEAVKKEGKARYEAITNVFAQPTPGLKPSSNLKEALGRETPEQKSARKDASREFMSKIFERNRELTPSEERRPKTEAKANRRENNEQKLVSTAPTKLGGVRSIETKQLGEYEYQDQHSVMHPYDNDSNNKKSKVLH